MRDLYRDLGMHIKAFSPQAGGDVVFVDAFVEHVPEVIVGGIGATHDRAIDLSELGVGDASEVKAAMDWHEALFRQQNCQTAEWQTAECLISLLRNSFCCLPFCCLIIRFVSGIGARVGGTGVFEEAVNERVEFLHFVRHHGGEVGGFTDVFAEVVEFVRVRILKPADQFEIAAVNSHTGLLAVREVGEVGGAFEFALAPEHLGIADAVDVLLLGLGDA